jgi:glycosyltransferase involved in cell wall biosynthesis
MRITWLSNAPWTRTGYGVQTKLFAPRVKELGHELALINQYGHDGGEIEWNGIRCYPRLNHLYGQDAGILFSKDFEADICIVLMDAWVYDFDVWAQHGIKVVPWFPVDSEPIAKLVEAKLKQTFQPVAYSRYGQLQAQAVGIDALYVPHGVDTAVFKPKPKSEAREFMGWPEDKFVFGMVANNKGYPARKAFYEQFKAFAMLHKQCPDTMLYCHANAFQGDGINLKQLAEHHGIEQVTYFPDQQRYVNGQLGDDYMVNVYNAMDCLLSVTMGEGFGVPILEAQACGTPVIVGDWTAMSELCFAGWEVDKEFALPTWVPTIDCYWFLPDPEAIYGCMSEAYFKARSQSLKDNARIGSLAYDADYVTREYWQPALSQIEQKLQEQSQVKSYWQVATEVV